MRLTSLLLAIVIVSGWAGTSIADDSSFGRCSVGTAERLSFIEDRLDGRKLQRQSVLAVSAIGDPTAFVAQLEAFGATVDSTSFRDHHRFTAAEAATLARTAERYDLVVCTLKDAVKLGPLWPRGSPLWYVSQRVVVERGAGAVEDVLTTTLLARSASIHSRRSDPS